MQPVRADEELYRGKPIIGYMELPPGSPMTLPANLALGVNDGGRQLIVGVMRVVLSLDDELDMRPYLPLAYVAIERGNGVVLMPPDGKLVVEIGKTTLYSVTVRCLNRQWVGSLWHEIPGRDYVALSVAGRLVAIVACCNEGADDRIVKPPVAAECN